MYVQCVCKCRTILAKSQNPPVAHKEGKCICLYQDSDRWSDDLSSGVFSSCNSQTDGQIEWLVSPHQPSSHCFKGKIAGTYSVWMICSCPLRRGGRLTTDEFTAQYSDTPGVDIWIENVRGDCLRIRERRQVKVGHVAIGISDQVRDG